MNLIQNPPDWGNIINKPAGLMTRFFDSNVQTITSGGSLTLNHNFGNIYLVPVPYLFCNVAEYGYSQYDRIYVDPAQRPVGNDGFSLLWDASNFYIRFGSDANVFYYFNKNTGAGVQLTNANWFFVMTAYGKA